MAQRNMSEAMIKSGLTEPMIDCSKFSGRLHDLCTGEGHDGRPDPRPEAVQAWRDRQIGNAIHQRVNVSSPESDHNEKPKTGPGSHLHALFASIGITPKVDCSCHLIMAEMDKNGPEYCRQQRDVLLNKMRGTASAYTWGETLRATWLTISSGLVWATGVSDPIGGMFDEAVRRSEAGEVADWDG